MKMIDWMLLGVIAAYVFGSVIIISIIDRAVFTKEERTK